MSAETATQTPAEASRGGALSRDLTASIVVFLVAMPLCMGIAIASGVPPEKGLVGSTAMIRSCGPSWPSTKARSR